MSAVIGFSTSTCLPAFSAASAISKWLETGVAMSTASIAGSAISVRQWLVQSRAGMPLFRAASAAGREIRNGRQVAACRLRRVAREVRAPVPVADDTDSNHVRLHSDAPRAWLLLALVRIAAWRRSLLAGVADDTRRHADDERVVGHVARHDRAGADERALADDDCRRRSWRSSRSRRPA